LPHWQSPLGATSSKENKREIRVFSADDRQKLKPVCPLHIVIADNAIVLFRIEDVECSLGLVVGVAVISPPNRFKYAPIRSAIPGSSSTQSTEIEDVDSVISTSQSILG